MLRWLHISDLHIKEKADWNNFKEELFVECKQIGKIDFVIVTGDFHDYADGDCFKQAIEFLRNLIKELNLNISEDLFLIPGNHDGVTNIKDKDTFVLAAKYNPLNISLDRCNRLLDMFQDYDSFVKTLIPDYPVEQPSAIHIRTWHDKIALIHCNTALAADGNEKKNQILDIDSLTELKIPKNIPILLLAHNSFFDLNEQQQDRIRAFIRINKNVCAYLCGDTHIESVKQIDFGSDQNEQIPCIISYKSAPDPMDTYSRFGIIVCDWEKRNAMLKGWYWQSREGFKVDDSIFGKTIDMKKEFLNSSSFKTFCDSDILKDCEDWKLIDKSVEDQKAKNLELSMKRYLIGYPCTWTLAFSNVLVIRKQISSLKLKIQEGGIIALLGAGAEGKSTLMRQLCVQLYQEGYFVLFHNQGGNYNLPNQLPDNTILVVDDPDDGRFVQLLNQVYENGITLFFTARYNEWNLLCERYNITSDVRRAITIIEMEKITDRQEAGAFADCILRYYKPKANKEEIEQIFLHNSGEYGFLYAAMLLVIYDKIKLEEIAADMVKKINNNNHTFLVLLGYAVLSEKVGIPFVEQIYQSILKKLSLKPRDAKNALELELQHKGNRRETRHPQISKLFYSIIFGENDYVSNADIDKMKYELLDSALSIYTQNINIEHKSNMANYIIALSVFINEVQEPSAMVQRVVEELRDNSSILQRILARITRDEICCAFAEKCNSYNIINSQILFRWANAKNKICGAGSYEEENSALWIYHEACMNRKVSGNDVWLGWAQLEKETHGAGGYGEESSALWIYHEACMNRKVPGSEVWLGWARLEKEAHGAGGYGEENSALWIYHEACMDRKVPGSGVWLGWAQLEKETHGAGGYGEENSALWIYHEACMNRKVSGNDVWLGWAQLEKETHGAGGYGEENSALWIYQEACMNRKVSGSEVWLGWAQLEKETHGAGGYGEENSALWIYQEACMNRKVSGNEVWLGWAQLEKETHGAGGYGEENSALWIYQEACMNRKASDFKVWLRWARDSSFSLDKKWSTIAILDYAMKFTHGETHVCKAYAECLMHNNCFEEARKTLRNMKNQNFGLSDLLIVEMIAGNTAEDDEYSVTTLIKRTESALEYSISAQYGLYMYYRYTKNKTEEYKYYSMLNMASRETLNIAQQMEEFLKDCQEAYNKVGFLSKDSDIL